LVVRRGHDDAGGSALGVVTRDGGFGRPGRNLGGKGYQRARRVVVGSDRIAVAVREFLNVAGEPPRGIVVIRIGLAGARAGPHAGACQLARRVILLNGHSPVAVGRGCAVGRNPAPAIVEIRDDAAVPVSDKPARGDSSRIVVPSQDVAVNSNVGAVAWIGVDLARIAKRVGVIGGGVPLTEGNGNGAPVTIRVACRVRRARCRSRRRRAVRPRARGWGDVFRGVVDHWYKRVWSRVVSHHHVALGILGIGDDRAVGVGAEAGARAVRVEDIGPVAAVVVIPQVVQLHAIGVVAHFDGIALPVVAEAAIPTIVSFEGQDQRRLRRLADLHLTVHKPSPYYVPVGVQVLRAILGFSAVKTHSGLGIE